MTKSLSIPTAVPRLQAFWTYVWSPPLFLLLPVLPMFPWASMACSGLPPFLSYHRLLPSVGFSVLQPHTLLTSLWWWDLLIHCQDTFSTNAHIAMFLWFRILIHTLSSEVPFWPLSLNSPESPWTWFLVGFPSSICHMLKSLYWFIGLVGVCSMSVSSIEAETSRKFKPSTQCLNKVSGIRDQENAAKQLWLNGRSSHYLRSIAKRLPKCRSLKG